MWDSTDLDVFDCGAGTSPAAVAFDVGRYSRVEQVFRPVSMISKLQGFSP